VRKILLLIGILFLPGINLFAQSMDGYVKSSRNIPLSAVTVKLIRLPDSVLAVATKTDVKGFFGFERIASGNYLIKVSAVGMKSLSSSKFSINPNQQLFHLPALVLTEENKVLKEVSITSKKQSIEISGGKLIFNVDQSPATTGSTAYELLQRLPGVSIDQDENLLLKGSPSVNVILDGKMTYLSARQLSNLMKSTSAENIRRIELINTPSAQFDAAGNSGIINIVTKKNNKPGYAADLSAGIGAGRYLQSAEGIIASLKTSKFNLFGSYNYSYDHSAFHRTSYRRVDFNGATTYYDRRSEDPSIANYNSYRAGIDYSISKNQQIGFVYNGNLNNWRRDADGPTYLRNGSEQITATVQNHNITTEPNRNNTFNLNYKTSLDTLGSTISVDADYAAYRNNSSGFQDNRLFDLSGNATQPQQSLRFSQPSNINIKSIKADLIIPVKTVKLLAGLKYASVKTDNNFEYDSLINNNYLFSPSLSNHFIYTENVSAAYLSGGKQWKRFSFNSGLRVEHTESDGNLISTTNNSDNKRSYTNLFPFLSLDFEANANHKFGLSVNRRIDRPAYSGLNPSRYYFDKYSYFQGNPNLKPELAWIVSANYSLLAKYIATFSYTRSTGPIAEQSTQDVATGIMVLTNVNFSHKDYFDLLLVAPVTATNFWEISNTADFYYQSYSTLLSNTVFTLHKLTADLSTINTFKLPGNFLLEAKANYTSPRLSGTYLLKYWFTTDVGLKKSFDHQKLDARLSVADVFHSIRYWAYNVTNIEASYNHNRDTRRINFSMVYHLGGKLSAGKEHRLEEQNRL